MGSDGSGIGIVFLRIMDRPDLVYDIEFDRHRREDMSVLP
jgi:hypothetical protein